VTRARRQVAITGCGVVSPLGLSRSAYLDALADGRSGIDAISLFDASTYPTRIAAEVRGFDPQADAGTHPDDPPGAFTDRKVGFLLAAARQALDEAFGAGASGAELGATGAADAPPARLPYAPAQRALSVGVGLEIVRMEDLTRAADGARRLDAERLYRQLAGRSPVEALRIPADVGPRLLAHRWGIEGPRLVNVSACVAGTQAIGQAMRLIRRGFDGMVIAAGADSMVNPLAVAGFGLLSATTTSNHLGAGASRPFDRLRDGFVLGEGAAAFVVEELSRARARGARVLALVEGYGTSLDAWKVTDPDERGAGAAAAMRRALADAGVAPRDVGYINAHGTSTRKNDAVESRAIHAVFGESARRIPVSSTKSMIGHTISAAGALELAASLLAFERDLLPPTINHQNPDPECDLDVIPNRAREARVDLVLSNSFGFGGQNATLIARRPPRAAGAPVAGEVA
jgi:3-oxoacyl-[acyl-carrier-protein] synthase II